MKKIFLLLSTTCFLHTQLTAQNTTYDSAAVPNSGVNNVAIGINALKVTTGIRNVGIGIGALENLGNASDNTAIGFNAMHSSAGTFFNTAVGKEALRNSQAPYNTAVGWGAMVSNVGGEGNTATGGLSLGANVSGIFNTANGYLSLNNNINGSGNTGMGVQALYTNAIGNYNTAMGRNALYNNTGSYNTAQGYESLLNNTTGEGNTANGHSSLLRNTTGTWNTANGLSALYFNTSGNSNTAFGLQSLNSNTTGDNNTATGRGALINNISGSNNAAFGYGADVSVDGLTNATAIGYQAKVTESNALQLGNNTVAKVFNGVGNNATFITGGLQVTGSTPGIGKVLTSDATGVATWQMPVTGIGGSGTLYYVSKFTPDGVTLGNSQIFDNGTNIGIGNAAPAAKLDITGNIKIADGTQGAGKVLTSDATGIASWQIPAAGGGSGWLLTGNAGTVDGTNFIGTIDSMAFNIRVNNLRAGRIDVDALTCNTFYGYKSGLFNSSGRWNTANGYDALAFNTIGEINTSVGAYSLHFNTTGHRNTAIGASALNNNTTGYGNTAVGTGALLDNRTGFNNTALGYLATISNIPNLENGTAIGYRAIIRQSNSIQLGNSFVTKIFAGTGTNATVVTGGLQVTGGTIAAGRVLTSDAAGVATWQTPAAVTPSWSLTGNAGTVDGTNFIGTTDNVPLNIRVNNQKAGRIESNAGIANTFFGYKSGENSGVSGSSNTAVGFNSLRLNSNGAGNTAIGYLALERSQRSYNTAVGGAALSQNTTGQFNTATGNSALNANSTGSFNTANGTEALSINLTGNNNTAVGYASNVATGNLRNTSAIGSLTVVNNDNKVRIGSTTVLVNEGQVAWSFPSDARFKENVNEKDVKGLDFILKLRPVVYNFDTKKFQKFLVKNMPDSVKDIYMNQDFTASTAVRQSGFIAQEVEKAAKKSGYDFNGVHKPENDNDNYSLAYSQFVVPLVKAVQEQQEMIEDLQKEIKNLKQNNFTETPVAVSEIELTDKNSVVLNQNVPNPFAQQTSISYNIPAGTTTAQILFYGMDGNLMKTANLTGSRKGVLHVFANDLKSGSYMYTLVVDGKLIDTKKLVKQ